MSTLSPIELERLLEVAEKMAPRLREQGVQEVIVSGLSMTLLPKPAPLPELDSENDQVDDSRRDPLHDPELYNRADGHVPGFAKLRK